MNHQKDNQRIAFDCIKNNQTTNEADVLAGALVATHLQWILIADDKKALATRACTVVRVFEIWHMHQMAKFEPLQKPKWLFKPFG
ncbi:MAG: hypothetical protein ACKVOU_11065 [Cytophagales bacterium]